MSNRQEQSLLAEPCKQGLQVLHCSMSTVTTASCFTAATSTAVYMVLYTCAEALHVQE